MSKTSFAGTTLFSVLALTGCYKTVGPVVTSVRIDKTGGLHYSRCNLVVGSTWLWIPDADLENCVNETHESLEAPAPMTPHTSSKDRDRDKDD
jgi:hypothetical protein